MDSGASRHMTGTLALLYDVKSINGSYVGFAGNQGGRIVGRGMLSNGVISFEKVNYIIEGENNLLSILQICDKSFSVHFTKNECVVLKPGFKIPDEMVLLRAPRENDLYILDMSVATPTTHQKQCFVSKSKAKEKETIMWHRKMGHIHVRKMIFLVHNDLVEGVNLKNFHLNDDCVACKKGKQTRKSHPPKILNSIRLPLERLHMDLFGPINVKSISGDLYCLVVTDDFTRFSWVVCIERKDQTFESLMVLFKKMETVYKLPIRRIRSDNGTEFKNNKMYEFCNEKGILHEFSASYTPQQNDVAERKNRTLIETARTMLADSKLPIFFWSEAVSAACYTLNRVLTVKKYKKTCFELLHRYKPNLEFLEPFGSPCTFIDENGKFGAKSNRGFFVGYASPLKRVFVPCLGKVIQVQHVDCQKHTPSPQLPGQRFLFDYDKLWESFQLPVQPSDEELVLLYQYQQYMSQEQVPRPLVVPPPTEGTHNDEIGPSGRAHEPPEEPAPTFDNSDDSEEESTPSFDEEPNVISQEAEDQTVDLDISNLQSK
ncbi:putative RNA-directed DNA polymerase [Helianthus annuus]|nr:putative RNA-directed DNA polymerase [Helianthus annuus]KAJ0607714.1 putative RNA-directed DNA polymerase [Helianthus annuus]KAJ0767779.1 putative RNA-directed DNA polymerase [Helianthus annuus]